MQNLAVQAVDLHTAYTQSYQKNYLARQRRKDQPWRRLATVNKIAQVKGWNLPNYREKRDLETLLKLYGEYSYLTGKRLGTYYLSTLDLDIWKEEFHFKLVNRLVKNMAYLLKFLQVSYDKTKKGLHVDILTPEPLDNGTIYWTDKLGKKWNIGSIQSQGKYVVGEDPNKAFIKSGKWYWITKSNEEVKTKLAQFFFVLSNSEKRVEKKEPKTSLIPLISIPNIHKPRHTIQAKILSKQKIPWLTDIWKVFYLEFHSKKTGYFLLNNYTRKFLTDLDVGTVKNICLIQEQKHRFFNCFL